MMAKILVTGVGGPAGRNAALLLLERGHSVVGTDMREVSLPGVKVCQVPAASAPHFLAELKRLAVDEGAELLIPTVSEELPVVAAEWEAQDGPRIPAVISPYEAVHLANDKYLTSVQLSEHDVGVPRYLLPSQVQSPAELASQVGWPCLTKPRVGRGGREVTVWTEEDWPAIAALDDGYIVQEFVSGADYSPNLHLGRDGDPVVVVLEKTKLKEGIVGNALEVERVVAPDVAGLAVSAARAMGLHGPLDIDVRRRADGTPVVLEINARFGANVARAPEVLDAMLASYGESAGLNQGVPGQSASAVGRW
jgi:carbamoylphosphate synthase large subunit